MQITINNFLICRAKEMLENFNSEFQSKFRAFTQNQFLGPGVLEVRVNTVDMKIKLAKYKKWRNLVEKYPWYFNNYLRRHQLQIQFK